MDLGGENKNINKRNGRSLILYIIVLLLLWATLFGTRVLKSYLVPRPLQAAYETHEHLPTRAFLFFLGRRLSVACSRFFCLGILCFFSCGRFLFFSVFITWSVFLFLFLGFFLFMWSVFSFSLMVSLDE